MLEKSVGLTPLKVAIGYVYTEQEKKNCCETPYAPRPDPEILQRIKRDNKTVKIHLKKRKLAILSKKLLYLLILLMLPY